MHDFSFCMCSIIIRTEDTHSVSGCHFGGDISPVVLKGCCGPSLLLDGSLVEWYSYEFGNFLVSGDIIISQSQRSQVTSIVCYMRVTGQDHGIWAPTERYLFEYINRQMLSGGIW